MLIIIPNEIAHMESKIIEKFPWWVWMQNPKLILDEMNSILQDKIHHAQMWLLLWTKNSYMLVTLQIRFTTKIKKQNSTFASKDAEKVIYKFQHPLINTSKWNFYKITKHVPLNHMSSFELMGITGGIHTKIRNKWCSLSVSF